MSVSKSVGHLRVRNGIVQSVGSFRSASGERKTFLGELSEQLLSLSDKNYMRYIDREPRTVIHVKRAKMFDPMG